uniref:Fatty acyl-CoA reductase n=1 Tax=Stomoxys calcitrans TaxID=35570 RepID=A0A1I8NWD6_STOCA
MSSSLRQDMSVEQFYADKDILITGGSGFIGKVLIEKILRSLPNVGKIYLLIRYKKDKSPKERLKEILDKPCFRLAREQQPQAFEKLVAIEGDSQELGLGISSEDLQQIQNVSVIFHVAATVRFDEKIKTAILLNTRGCYELVKIAQNLSNLKAFIHVSTAYSHPYRYDLKEMIYPLYYDWRTAIKLAETYDVETLNPLFPKLASKHPNTYTFTKYLAEAIIDEYRHKLPVAIVRPSIVVSSYKEPMPGWIDNINGPVGMLLACGTGIMRTSHGNPHIVSDMISVDMCSNSLLVAAYKVGTNPSTNNNGGPLEVFNCCQSSTNHVTTGDIVNMGKEVVLINPFEKCIWLPEGSITPCPVWHYWRLLTLQIIPAILLDGLLFLARKPPFLVKVNRHIYHTTKILKTFMNNEWLFYNDKFKELETVLTDKDLSKFGFLGFSTCDKFEYYQNCGKGIKEFLLNEKPIACKGAHIRMRTFQFLHYLLQFLLTYHLARYLLESLYKYVCRTV